MRTYFRGKTYSVGDGFCYEGVIDDRKIDNSYHFVIDCGSQVSNNKEVKKAKKAKKINELINETDCNQRLEDITTEISRNGEEIDLFVLSHLHKDHYNGYLKLLKKTKVGTIIMPYL